jgi:aminoglycoside phosphotransferase (APT) family kinase protein
VPAPTSAPLSTAALSACVRRHLDAVAPRITAIATGKFNSSYFVDTDCGSYVLRVAPPADAVFVFYERRMMHQEPAIHRRLRGETDVPVPQILAFDATHADIPRDYLLMTRLPGAPLSDCADADVAAVHTAVGQSLAAAHALTADAYGYIGAHQPMPPAADWGTAFADMWQRLIADVAATGHYTAAEAEMMVALQRTYAAAFDRAVPAALLHMDVWAQNILVADGRMSGLIDWDRALWGDPEIEFAVLDYCGISTPAFWHGYGCRRDTSQPARLRRVFYLLYEIQKYIVIRHGRNGDPVGARQYRDQTFAMVRETFADR